MKPTEIIETRNGYIEEARQAAHADAISFLLRGILCALLAIYFDRQVTQ